jgi:hypothetical protein
MNTRNAKQWLLALGACTALAAVDAYAADDETVPAPSPQRFENVEVINGGSSYEEVDAIKRVAPQYRLRVELSGRNGEWDVADRLKVLQNDRVIAEVPDAGPYLLMDVPAGRYTLVGEFADRLVRRDVQVADSGTTVHWVLPWKIEN